MNVFIRIDFKNKQSIVRKVDLIDNKTPVRLLEKDDEGIITGIYCALSGVNLLYGVNVNFPLSKRKGDVFDSIIRHNFDNKSLKDIFELLGFNSYQLLRILNEAHESGDSGGQITFKDFMISQGIKGIGF